MTFVPIRLRGDRITLKDGSHWTITDTFGRTGIDDYYEVENGKRSRFVYADEIASPAPMMRGLQSIGRILRPPMVQTPTGRIVRDYAGNPGRPTLEEWTARHDAARATRGEGRLAQALGFRPALYPYQRAAMDALTGPSIRDLIASGHLTPFKPGAGKAHYHDCDFPEEKLRAAMDGDGWLPLDGQDIDGGRFPELRAVIGCARLPLIEGHFVRAIPGCSFAPVGAIFAGDAIDMLTVATGGEQ